MKVFVVPPHADFTLEWAPPEGFEPLDLARAFAGRVLSGEAIDAELLHLQGAGDPDACRRRVSLEVAKALLARSGSTDTRLRALGAAFSGLSRPGGGVKLRLDDLELEHGSTERIADVQRASEASSPFAAELERAVQGCARAARVRIGLERDQQLPFVFALARRIDPSRVELCGPFAAQHRQALAPLFPGARFVEAAPPARICGAPGLPAEGWSHDLEDASGWAGPVPVEALRSPDRLAASGARVVLLPFCAWDEEVVALSGRAVPRAEVERAISALQRAGVKVAGEWWVGAPGIGGERLERTLAGLASAPLDWLLGIRPFHWTRGREGPPFGAVQVELLPPPADRELWRSHPFRAAGTLSPEALAQALEALPVQWLSQGRTLAAGRLAQACVTPPPLRGRGGRIGFDPDCALISVAHALDGRPGPVSYAVNLRNGVTMAVDPRLVGAVQALRVPAPAAEALGALGAQREKVLRALLAKGVLAEVE